MTPDQLKEFASEIAANIEASRPPPEPQRVQEPQAPPAQAVDPLQQYGLAGLRDDELVEAGAMKELARNMESRYQNLVGAAQQIYQGQATQYETLSKMADKNIWDKYGPEVQKEVEAMKQVKVVDADDYQRAIDIVKGRHIQDYVKEGVDVYMQNAPPTDISGGSGGGTGMSPPEAEIPEHWQKHLSDNGITKADIVSMLNNRRDYYGSAPSFEEYMTDMDNHTLIRDDKGWRADDLIPPPEPKK